MPWKEKPDSTPRRKRNSEAGARGGLASAAIKAQAKQREINLRRNIGRLMLMIMETEVMLTLLRVELTACEKDLEKCSS